ncbi:MAG: aminotransferase class I/II-fold pyridoxal phosphate-dependent enzyme [Deltaproteobacteria bacterium]|nr:aminotransferase class I/II-fold pyridoxal phosphate-dependent enzyme [Deltaproteobacteria bacterium]
MTRIYLSPPHMSPDERLLLLDAFDSNWIAPLGPHVDAFEREMVTYLMDGQAAARTGGELHALALSSGTSALHLALIELGVGPGDRVLCSSLTFSASANVIRYVGAEPVFVDTALSSWNLDPVLVAEELETGAREGKRYKAVIAVDLYGDPADLEPIRADCQRYGAALIEDAAEAAGSSYRDRKCGTMGDLSVLSFNGNKILTTAGGGMLLSANERWIDHARKLSTQAREPAPHYQHQEIGYNYRLSNLLAAVGRGQLRWLDERIARKYRIRAFYEGALSGLPGVSFLPLPAFGRSNCWLTCIQVDPAAFGATREDIRLHLESLDIEARPVWKPMHMQPVFRECRVIGGAVSEDLFERGLCLPSGSSLTDADLDRVLHAVTDVIARHRG